MPVPKARQPPPLAASPRRNRAIEGPVPAAYRDRAWLIARSFLDLNARLPDNPRLFRFPGSSVVERRTVNPLVGGSNPSRGATLCRLENPRRIPNDYRLDSNRRHRQAGSTTPRSGGDRPQGDPEGVRREAPNNPSRGATFSQLENPRRGSECLPL
jgi:hypothetical protein